MPSLTICQEQNANLLQSLSYTIPVAIFVGGTSGIGQATAEAFARHCKGNAHIVIVGRNQAAAESIISRFPQPTAPEAKHEFVHCDALLMKNVHSATDSLKSRLERTNYLFLTCGTANHMGPRDETEEGLDKMVALRYYARWKFIYDLQPLLKAAKDKGEAASVVSVMVAGMGKKVDMDDFGLKKTYSTWNMIFSPPTYNDAMIEPFSELNPGVHFGHTHPGLVDTPMFARNYKRPLIGPIIKSASWLFTTNQDICAEHMLWALLHSEAGSSRTNQKGDDIGKKGYYVTAEMKDRLWKHTLETVDGAVGSNGT